MATYRITKTSFDLLAELKENNTKEWFDQHRNEMKEHLTTPFADLLETASERLHDHLIPMRGNAKTMFRLHRDVRFSPDKTPYNTHVSGVLTPSGTKNEKEGLLYLHLNDGGGFIAAGFYQLSTAELGKVRDSILARTEDFAAIISGLQDFGHILETEGQLKTMQRGYSEFSGDEHSHFLRLKGYYFMKNIPKKAWMDGRVLDTVESFSRSGSNLITFVADALK